MKINTKTREKIEKVTGYLNFLNGRSHIPGQIHDYAFDLLHERHFQGMTDIMYSRFQT